MEAWIRFCLAAFVVSALAVCVDSAGAAQLSVVPNGEPGPFRHGTYPSLGDRTHVGLDILAPCGTPVYPLADGRVVDFITASTDRDWNSLGYMLIVEHPNSLTGRVFYTMYLHLQEPPSVIHAATPDVSRDAPIGRVGNTGNTRGTCHLHFEVRYFKERYHRNWGNIYGPGDQRNSPVFKSGWEDPILFLERGVFQRPKAATPTSYGVYVRHNSGQLIELKPESAETGLANVAGPYALYPRCCAKGPHPKLPAGSVEIVVFLRGLTAIKPVLREFVYVRQLEKVQVDLFGRPQPRGYRSLVKPDEWIAAYNWPLMMSPVSNQPDMIIIKPRTSTVTPGLYGFVIEPSGLGAMRYPETGQLMFWVDIDQSDKATRCTDWQVKLTGLSGGEVTIHECSGR